MNSKLLYFSTTGMPTGCRSAQLGAKWLLRAHSYRKSLHLHTRSATLGTWSALTSVFNTKPNKEEWLFINKNPYGLFKIPELREDIGIYALQEQAHVQVNRLIKEATSPERSRKIVVIFDELSDCLCRVADLAEFIRVSHPDERYSTAAEETCVNLSGLVEKLNTNTEIHRVLKDVLENGDVVPTDSLDRRVGELFMFDFEQSGIHLDENKRKIFVELNENALTLGHNFLMDSQQPFAVPKDLIPESIRDCFHVKGHSVMVTGLLADHFNGQVREAAYKLFLYPNNQRLMILDSMLKFRNKIAKLVGFETYGQRALKGTLAETPEFVMQFLEKLAAGIREKANEDYSEMLKLKQKDSGLTTEVFPWDVPYYTALGKHQLCKINGSELAQYLSVGSCMEGLSNLFRCLFDVTLQHIPVGCGEVWHHEVHKIAVVHSTEGVLGYIYCDFFERADKPNQDSHYTIRGGRETSDGSYQLPIVVLQLNLPPPYHNVPSLLTPGQMENLFHEFGHAMHSMLGRTKYQHTTGTRCSTDFAEVPSILMEYFASDPRVLRTFAYHYQTGEPLPAEKLQAFCQAKRMFSASDMQQQVFFAMLDQKLHDKYPFGKTSTEVMAEIQNKYYGIPYVENTAWHLRFGHLVGYGAKYYSYLLARGVASMIWHTCFKQDPFNRSMGESYKKEMLAHGGGIHPKTLIEGMLKRTVTMDHLVNSLISDLEDTRTPS